MSMFIVSPAVIAAVLIVTSSELRNPFDHILALISCAASEVPKSCAIRYGALRATPAQHAIDGELDPIDIQGGRRNLDQHRPDRLRARLRRDKGDIRRVGSDGDEYINDDDRDPLHGSRKRFKPLSNCRKST